MIRRTRQHGCCASATGCKVLLLPVPGACKTRAGLMLCDVKSSPRVHAASRDAPPLRALISLENHHAPSIHQRLARRPAGLRRCPCLERRMAFAPGRVRAAEPAAATAGLAELAGRPGSHSTRTVGPVGLP